MRFETQTVRSVPRRAVAVLRRVPASVWLKLVLLAGILAVGLALVLWTPVGDYFTRERMVGLFEHLGSFWWAPLLLIGLYVVTTPLGFIPASPLVIAGGLVFGPVRGSVYNIVGLVAGAMAGYYVARALGREFVVRIAGERLRQAEKVFQRRAFWPLVQTRFLPIPFPVVSYGAAVAGVPAPMFFASSALGIAPATAVHTYFMPAMILRPSWTLGAVYLALVGLLNLVAGWQNVREWWRHREHRRELEESSSPRERGLDLGDVDQHRAVGAVDRGGGVELVTADHPPEDRL